MIFFNLMKKEMKYQMKGIVFWLVILLTVFFLYTQFGIYSTADLKPKLTMNKTIRVEPSKEADYYINSLENDLKEKTITKNSIAKSKVKLSNKAKEKMSNIVNNMKMERNYYEKYNNELEELNEILGGESIYSVRWRKRLFDKYLSPVEEMRKTKKYLEGDLKKNYTFKYGINEKEIVLSNELKNQMKVILEKYQNKENLTGREFNSFLEDLAMINQNAGENTIYGQKWRQIIVEDKLYYQRKLSEFNKKLEHGLTDSYGRLFADYLGIAVGFFPIFIGAFLINRDRRTGMEEFIRSRKINPYLYLGAKIASVFIVLGIFYLLLTLIPTFNFYQLASENSWNFQVAGFLKYTAGWVLPTLLFVLSFTIFISEFFGSPLLAVGIQLIWLFKSMIPLKGDYSLSKYIIRFNSSSSYELYERAWEQIFLNRIFYIGLSFVFFFLAARIWQAKNITDERGYNVISSIFKI